MRIVSLTALALTVIAILSNAAELRAQQRPIVPVSDVLELYKEVDDPDNTGARLVLAPGDYPLINDPNQQLFVNEGRLELQPGMTLEGQADDPSLVEIDASGLSSDALTYQDDDGNNILTGAIRVGAGDNTIKWLTVSGAANGAAAIETDLGDAGSVEIRIAHVVVTGSVRGIDVRNNFAEDRQLTVLLEDNEMHGNTAGIGQGFRIVNTNASDGARIDVTMRGNRSYDNDVGCQVANLNTSEARITIDSQADVIADNVIGCIFFAGNGNTATDANDNTIIYTAQGGSYTNNAPGTVIEDGAIVAVAGLSLMSPGNASRNTLLIELWGTTFFGNETDDVKAWGARFDGDQPAGTHNRTEIRLQGVSKQATVMRPVASAPPEAVVTNEVNVAR